MTNYQLSILIRALTTCFQSVVSVQAEYGSHIQKEKIRETFNELERRNGDLIHQLDTTTVTGQSHTPTKEG